MAIVFLVQTQGRKAGKVEPACPLFVGHFPIVGWAIMPPADTNKKLAMFPVAAQVRITDPWQRAISFGPVVIFTEDFQMIGIRGSISVNPTSERQTALKPKTVCSWTGK